EMTGAHTRVVWAQAVNDHGDYGADKANFRLLGLDTEDGKAVRVIRDEVASYGKPMLTPDGQRVIYSNRRDNTVYAIDFNGSNHTKLVSGYASDIWADPPTGVLWLYVRDGQSTKHPIVRYR